MLRIAFSVILLCALCLATGQAGAQTQTLLINRAPDLSDDEIIRIAHNRFSCILVRTPIDSGRENRESPTQVADAIRAAISQSLSTIRVVNGATCRSLDEARRSNQWLAVDVPRMLPFGCVTQGSNPSCSPLPSAPSQVSDALIDSDNRLAFIVDSIDINRGLASIPLCDPATGCRPYHQVLRDQLVPLGYRVLPRMAWILGGERRDESLWNLLLLAKSRGTATVPATSVETNSPLRDACSDLLHIQLRIQSRDDSVLLTCPRPTGQDDLELNLTADNFTRMQLPRQCAGVPIHVADAVQSVILSLGRTNVYGPTVVAYGAQATVELDGSVGDCVARAGGFHTYEDFFRDRSGITYTSNVNDERVLPRSNCYRPEQLDPLIGLRIRRIYAGRPTATGTAQPLSLVLEMSRPTRLLFRFQLQGNSSFGLSSETQVSFPLAAEQDIGQFVVIDSPVPVCE